MMNSAFHTAPDINALASVAAFFGDSQNRHLATLTNVIQGLAQIRTSNGFKTNVGDFVTLDYGSNHEINSFQVGIFALAELVQINDTEIRITCIARSLSDEHSMISDIRTALSSDARNPIVDMVRIKPVQGLRTVVFQLVIKLPNGATK
jgi:hypothetical protein